MKKELCFGLLFSLILFSLVNALTGWAGLDIVFEISISEPQNISYSFNKSLEGIYPVNFSVETLNRNLSLIPSWKYELNGIEVNFSVLSGENYTVINATRGSNELIVYANDSSGNERNASVIFYIDLPNTAPDIENISSNILICENDYLNYHFNVTDVDGDSLTPSLSLLDPFYIASNGNFNSTLFMFRIFSGILTKEDVGGVNSRGRVFEEIVSISDGNDVDSENFNITLIEINNPPEVEDIGVNTIWTIGDNSEFFHEFLVNDTESGNQSSGNLTFSITIWDSLNNTINLFSINSTGVMNYSSNGSDVGVYIIEACAEDLGLNEPHQNISFCNQDGGPIKNCDNFSLTITDSNREPNITSYSPENLTFRTLGTNPLNFSVVTYDPDGTIPDVLWYVDDVLKKIDSFRSTSEFSYTFGCGVLGDRTVRAVVSDGELNNSIEWNISVRYVTCPISELIKRSGAGGATLFCKEEWGCKEWSECINLDEAFKKGLISFDTNFLLKERCFLFNWSLGVCGYQVRECVDVNKCGTNYFEPGKIRECYYTENPNCFDNIKNCHNNSCEVGVDCGGPCAPCPTCSDGICNQNESCMFDSIFPPDCGGPCAPCEIPRPVPFPTKNMIIFSIVIIFGLIIVLIIILVISKR